MGGVLDRSNGMGLGHSDFGRLRSRDKTICPLHLEETKKGTMRRRICFAVSPLPADF